jgi:hypothetical protein
MREAPPDAWRIVAATSRGESHAATGAPNQDYWGEQVLTCGAQVIAVADGAGSRDRSDRGARLAVDGALAAAERHFAEPPPVDDDVAWQAIAANWARDCAREFDERLAAEIAEIPRHPGVGARAAHATTLTAVVWRAPWFAVYTVGDCFIVLDHAPGHSRLLWPTEFRENAGVTVFMTSANRDAETYTMLVRDPGLRGLAVCSDGLAEATLTVRPTASGFRYVVPADFTAYFDVFAKAEDADAVLHQRISSPEVAATSSDDKTMVLAVRTR